MKCGREVLDAFVFEIRDAPSAYIGHGHSNGKLREDARRIQKKAEEVKDYRGALAAVRELTRLVELAARLSGELNERPETKILNLTLDPETARRMAETFLARHQGVNPT